MKLPLLLCVGGRNSLEMFSWMLVIVSKGSIPSLPTLFRLTPRHKHRKRVKSLAEHGIISITADFGEPYKGA